MSKLSALSALRALVRKDAPQACAQKPLAAPQPPSAQPDPAAQRTAGLSPNPTEVVI